MLNQSYHPDDPPVTVMVTLQATPGREAEFEKFLTGITAAATTVEGHLGTNIFRPATPEDHEYRVIFKFDRLSNLRRWVASDERKHWYAYAKPLVQTSPKVRVFTGLETWFTLPGQHIVPPPPRYKMALLSWLAIYPLVTSILAVGGSRLLELPLAVRTFVLTAVLTPTMTYLVMPWLTQRFASWLYPTVTTQTETIRVDINDTPGGSRQSDAIMD